VRKNITKEKATREGKNDYIEIGLVIENNGSEKLIGGGWV